MSDDAAAEAAERKRVMEAVAHCLDATLHAWREYAADEGDLKECIEQSITELRTPVGREKNQ